MIVSENHYAKALRGKTVTPVRQIDGVGVVIAKVNLEDMHGSGWAGNGSNRDEWAFAKADLLD